MKLYWRIRSLPELDHLSDEQRSQLLKSHVRRGTIGTILYSTILIIVAVRCLYAFCPLPIALPSGILLIVATHLYGIRSIRVAIQMQIIEMYRGQQLPICLNCGYDLRNIEVTQCPECGAAVRAKLKQSK